MSRSPVVVVSVAIECVHDVKTMMQVTMSEQEHQRQGLGPEGIGAEAGFPETPHDLPVDRAKIDAVLERVRKGEKVTLLDEFLAAVDWRRSFAADDEHVLDAEDIGRLIAYYQEKFSDIGPVYLAELMSTEFITEQRGRGDIVFSDRLLELGRTEPDLWNEIRSFFRRKEFATAILVHAHRERPAE